MPPVQKAFPLPAGMRSPLRVCSCGRSPDAASAQSRNAETAEGRPTPSKSSTKNARLSGARRVNWANCPVLLVLFQAFASAVIARVMAAEAANIESMAVIAFMFLLPE